MRGSEAITARTSSSYPNDSTRSASSITAGFTNKMILFDSLGGRDRGGPKVFSRADECWAVVMMRWWWSKTRRKIYQDQ
jgi:hypothetical protein